VNDGACAHVVLATEAAPDGSGGLGAFLGEHGLLLAVIAVVAVVALLVALYLIKYLRLAVNLFLDTPLPTTANLHDYTPPEGEIVTFPSLEGRRLRGMFIERPAGVPDRGTILFCHEYSADMLSAGRYASGLVQAGYTVFTFDFRGHGASFTPSHYEPRYWPSNYEVHDILAAIAYVKSQRNLGKTGLGILGVSRGASAALLAAALNTDIRCLAVDGAYSTDCSIDGLVKRWIQIFARVDLARADRTMTVNRLFRALVMFYVELKCRCRFPSTRRALAKLESVPVLFIHGQRDAYVPVEQARALFDEKPGDKDIWICPNAKHNQAVATDPDTYNAKVLAFFGRHLGPAGEANDTRPGPEQTGRSDRRPRAERAGVSSAGTAGRPAL